MRCIYYIFSWIIIGGFLLMSTLSVNNTLNITLIKKLALQTYQGNQVLANLTTAQAILESNLLGSKPSQLAFKYNNLFGIKGSGTKGSVTLMTTEYRNGEKIEEPHQFAWNISVEDSIKQRQNLFEHGTSDNPARYYKVLKATTFEEAAKAVKDAGYATDPTYTKQLINIYNKYLKGK
jgi:flagellum-specific peptidoglycan hydrolase FlgJ